MKFDINALESSAESTYDLKVGERDDGSPVGFRLVGASSEAYRKAAREIEVMNVRESAARKALVDMATDEGAAYVVDGGIRRASIIVAACVVDWFGFTIGETEPAPFTAENLDRVLKARPAWRGLILGAIEDERNFFAG